MVKRIVSLAITVIMALSILGGCGTQTTATTATTATAAAQDTQAAPAATTAEPAAATTAAEAATAVALPLSKEKVNLSYWMFFNPRAEAFLKDMNDNPVYKEAEKRTNVHINFTLVHPMQQAEKFNLAVASDTYPGLVLNMSNLYNGGIDKAISDGVVIPLNDKMDKLPNYKKVTEVSDEARKNAKTDGGNYGEFLSVMINETGAGNGPMVRGDWLEELGIASPETYDDYYNMLKAFKEKKNATGAFLLQAKGVQTGNYLTAGYGLVGVLAMDPFMDLPFYQVDGKVKFGPTEPGFKEYITMISKWYSEGLIYKDYLKNTGFNNTEVESAILNGESGLWHSDLSMMPTYAQKSADKKFKTIAIQDAVKNKGDKMHVGTNLSNYKGGGVCITDNCENVDVALAWCDYWYSDEGSLLANYGVEGDTYSLVDGKPVLGDKIFKNKDMDSQLAVFCFLMEQGGFVQDRSRTNPGYTQDQLNAGTIWTTNKDYSYLLPNISQTPDESTEFSVKINDIATFAMENIHKFIQGKTPMTEYDSFVQKMKDMGIDKCIALKQAALDRYNAR
ncbi:MAG: extracellular solute-binding protein [Clostridiales bacterium]|nr:extracellular solute-binding protein [Clostridiales bacterium]